MDECVYELALISLANTLAKDTDCIYNKYHILSHSHYHTVSCSLLNCYDTQALQRLLLKYSFLMTNEHEAEFLPWQVINVLHIGSVLVPFYIHFSFYIAMQMLRRLCPGSLYINSDHLITLHPGYKTSLWLKTLLYMVHQLCPCLRMSM